MSLGHLINTFTRFHARTNHHTTEANLDQPTNMFKRCCRGVLWLWSPPYTPGPDPRPRSPPGSSAQIYPCSRRGNATAHTAWIQTRTSSRTPAAPNRATYAREPKETGQAKQSIKRIQPGLSCRHRAFVNDEKAQIISARRHSRD